MASASRRQRAPELWLAVASVCIPVVGDERE